VKALVLLALGCAMSFAQNLPEAPQPQSPRRQIEFFTFAPNRSTRQTLHSSWFLVPNSLAVIAAIANVKRARPAYHAGYGDALGPLGAVIGFNFVLDRFVSRALAAADAGAATALRTIGAATRTYQ
jgi:hypothetical protein